MHQLLGYELITKSQRWELIEIPLELCQDSDCLPKAGNFLWAAIQNRILTAGRFMKMGFEGPSRCLLCKNNSKTDEHILFSCPFARNCWSWLCNNLNWHSAFQNNLLDHLKSWPKKGSSKIYNNLWRISPSILLSKTCFTPPKI